MSTNAYIQVEGSDVVLYKHWDGYASATLPWLLAFHANFEEKRGFSDPSYETAQLVRSSVFQAKEYNLDDNPVLGWGLSVEHNIKYEGEVGQFVYVLHKDGSVSVNGHKYRPGDEIVFKD